METAAILKNQLCLMVTGACNLSCPNCSQSAWRADFADYHMTPDEILAVSLNAQTFDAVHIAGGEPTLWRHFEDGCVAICDSGLSDRIVVSSNCIEHDRLIAALDAGLINKVYCQTSNASPAGIRAIQSTHPKRIIIGRRTVHKRLPAKPLSGVLPARCGCDRPAIFAGRVYQCADVYPHSKRMRYDAALERASVPVNDNGRNWLDAIREMDRLRHPACRVCLANNRVWKRVP